MMHDTFMWIPAAMIGLVWTLRYAVSTLYRMQGKIVYPLLRVRSKHGHDGSVVLTRETRFSVRWPAAIHTLC